MILLHLNTMTLTTYTPPLQFIFFWGGGGGRYKVFYVSITNIHQNFWKICNTPVNTSSNFFLGDRSPRGL